MLQAVKDVAPMIECLSGRAKLSDVERGALRGLPWRCQNFGQGGRVMRQGDGPTEYCAVLTGFAYRYKSNGRGKRMIVGLHHQGELVSPGLACGLADYSLHALPSATIAYVPWTAIEAVAHEFPGVQRALWVEGLIEASRTRAWLANVGLHTARQRIAHLFCELIVRQRATDLCMSSTFVLPLTQQELGDATGLTAVHVNRVIKELRADEMIQPRSRTLMSYDWAALQRECDFDPAYLHLPEQH